ncbi:MAG: outer membrane protein assembly factor BamD [Acidobacteriia bacterium]|nr:outer membrane protein assembly factor BamD [Terriglobia bacterium]
MAEPDLEKVTSLRRILANSDPRARLMLESSLSSIRSHKFLEARLALQILIKTYPDDQAVALAHWALALGYYREGGLENLRIAADQFSKFSHLYESDKNLEELVQAAQLDVAVIQIELMCLSASEKGWPIAEFATYDTGAMPAGTLALSELDTMMTADNAILNLQMFLSQWPDSPYAPAARASLEQVQEFLAGRR